MSKQSTAHRAPDMPTPFPPVAALNGQFVEAFMHTGEAYAKACVEWQQEILRFMGSRLQWDGRVGEALAKCKTVSEIAEVQRDWAMSTAQEYFDEANRLAQLATRLVPSWMPSAAHRSAESKAEAPPHAAE